MIARISPTKRTSERVTDGGLADGPTTRTRRARIPGVCPVALQKATLDPETWHVHFEAEGKNPSGAAVRYVIDGKLENIGAYQRFITGTWAQGNTKGDFKITRN